MVTKTCDRFRMQLELAGTRAHTTTGLAERSIALTKLTAYKLWADCEKEGLPVTKGMIVSEAAIAGNQVMVSNGDTRTHTE